MKAWKWFSSRRQKLLFSFLINVLYLLTLLILMRPIEVTDDDLLFKTMCNGVYGSYNAHMVLINCLLGKFLNGLYMIFPTIEWFDCIQYIILLISFSIITYVIINEFCESIFAMVPAGIVLLFWGYEGYIRIQFTKTCGIATCAGVLLIIFASTDQGLNRQKRALMISLGIAIALAGSFYRFEQFWACYILMTGLVIYTLVSSFQDRKKNIKGKGIRQVFSLIIANAILMMSGSKGFPIGPSM